MKTKTTPKPLPRRVSDLLQLLLRADEELDYALTSANGTSGLDRTAVEKLRGEIRIAVAEAAGKIPEAHEKGLTTAQLGRSLPRPVADFADVDFDLAATMRDLAEKIVEGGEGLGHIAAELKRRALARAEAQS